MMKDYLNSLKSEILEAKSKQDLARAITLYLMHDSISNAIGKLSPQAMQSIILEQALLANSLLATHAIFGNAEPKKIIRDFEQFCYEAQNQKN